MKKFKATLVALALTAVIGILGCRSLIDSATPTSIDRRAKVYSAVDPNFIGAWESLNDAREVRTEIIINHRDTQTDLKRLAQDDVVLYKDALGFIESNIQEAIDLQGLVIGSPENPFSIMGMLAPLGIGAIAGSVLIKRKEDYSPEQYKAAVAKAKVAKQE